MEGELAEMMTADTNVFVYVWDNRFPDKVTVASKVSARLAAVGSAISVQVVGEVQNVLSKKLKFSNWMAAQTARNLLAGFDIYSPSRANAEEALGEMAAGRHSYWDALMLTAARDAGCSIMFSEDMQDGAKFGSLEIVNPFGVAGPSDRARDLLSL